MASICRQARSPLSFTVAILGAATSVVWSSVLLESSLAQSTSAQLSSVQASSVQMMVPAQTPPHAFSPVTPQQLVPQQLAPQQPVPKQAPHAGTAAKTAVEIGPDPFNETTSLAAPSSAQMTEMTEPDGTTVILPPGYEAGRSYPALVLMPYTDRTALHMFNWGIYDAYHRRSENAFVIIMPPGQGSSANWSGGGWEALVNEYETYVQRNLDPIAAKYNVDPNQMVIGGFSLGGDLSWALSLRNPAIFSGAIVMGSMSNYRDANSAQTLAARDFRYFMVMGGYDGNRGSMYNALDTLDQHNIDYHYEEVSNAGHGDLPEQMQSDLFLSAMDYVLSERVAAFR